jgi:nitrate reductase gamma subunit
MDLLAFARGPALWLSIAIFATGIAWRLRWLLRWRVRDDLSAIRPGAPAPLRIVIARLWPRARLARRVPALSANAFAWHAALAAVLLGFGPHIVFVERLTGIGWPALPGWIVGLAVATALFGLLFALMMRIASPVTRAISGPDDYASWALTVLPFLTGMGAIYLPLDMLYPWIPDRPAAAAIHLLSFEVLLAWLPFGKLAHAALAFASRGASAAAFARKGAAA